MRLLEKDQIVHTNVTRCRLKQNNAIVEQDDLSSIIISNHIDRDSSVSEESEEEPSISSQSSKVYAKIKIERKQEMNALSKAIPETESDKEEEVIKEQPKQKKILDITREKMYMKFIEKSVVEEESD